MTKPTPAKKNEKNKLPVGLPYFAILGATLFLLLVTVLSLVIGLALGLEDGPALRNPSGSGNRPQGTEQADTPKKPIYPTNETRDSYLFTSVSGTQTISGISSKHAILVSLETYEAIAQKDADVKIYPASMFKVMSLLVASERVTDLTEKVTVAAEDVEYAQEMGGSGTAMLKAGEILTVKDLLYLTSYNSDTIAVLTVAKHLAGDEATFVGWMNAKAAELGLTNTRFANCTGLHDENNYTTCREMATIMAYALENSLCRQLLTDYREYRYETNLRGDSPAYAGWYSVRFKDNPNLKTVRVMGGKTGYEDIPTSTFVTYAMDDSKKGYICVVVGRSDVTQEKVTNAASTNDTKLIYQTYVK